MPKLFPIHIEVEEVAVGRVMRLLNGLPGVAKFHLDMDRPSSGHKPNGAGRAHSPNRKQPGRFDISGEQAILYLLHDKGAMTSHQLADTFVKQGRSGKSISSCLHKLRSEDMINSTADGYSLTKKSRDRLRNRKKSK